MNVAIEEAAATSDCSQSPPGASTSSTRNRTAGVLKKLLRRNAASKKKLKNAPANDTTDRDITLHIEDRSCYYVNQQQQQAIEITQDEKSSSSSSKESRRAKILSPLSSKSCSGSRAASKLLMGLKPSDMDRVVSCIDDVGSNVLHLACYKGASFDAISHLLSTCSPSHRKMLVNARDKDGRVPVQIAVECICRDKISLEEGMQIVQILHEADPFIIHNSDESMHNAIDVVFLSLIDIHSQSDEYKRLFKLYSFVRSLSIEAYKEKKKLWERNGPSCKNKTDDTRTQNTESTAADYSICPSEMSAVDVMKVFETSDKSDGEEDEANDDDYGEDEQEQDGNDMSEEE